MGGHVVRYIQRADRYLSDGFRGHLTRVSAPIGRLQRWRLVGTDQYHYRRRDCSITYHPGNTPCLGTGICRLDCAVYSPIACEAKRFCCPGVGMGPGAGTRMVGATSSVGATAYCLDRADDPACIGRTREARCTILAVDQRSGRAVTCAIQCVGEIIYRLDSRRSRKLLKRMAEDVRVIPQLDR